MGRNGFKLIGPLSTKMVFVPVRMIDRIKFRFDDKIEVDNSSSEVTQLQGSRRVVYSVIYKLGREVL